MQGKKKKKKRGCQSINFSDIKHLSKQARRDDRVNRIERAGKKLQSANACSPHCFGKQFGERKKKRTTRHARRWEELERGAGDAAKFPLIARASA